MHQHNKDFEQRGIALDQAKKVMIMVHGRGADPTGILGLADHLTLKDFALLAPRAKGNTWYPLSFMAPTAQNEPGLSSGLAVLQAMVEDVKAVGFTAKDIYLLGFSQGACLTAEFAARHAEGYGGIFLYSGGLIGPVIDQSNYQGDFAGTPVVLGCSDVDGHVPLHRVKDTTKVLTEMGAEVNERIYPNAPHTIFPDEIEQTNRILQLAD
ncbi:MAG: dienelactone hydrolase family protein [Bacteroidota bacterium]